MYDKGVYRSPAIVIVLTIVTCGIYALIWIYKFSKEINSYVEVEDMKPGLELFLCIICFPYVFYWSYKYGKLIAEAQKRASVTIEDNAILFLILSVFGLFIVNMAIMQDSVNKIWANEPI